MKLGVVEMKLYLTVISDFGEPRIVEINSSTVNEVKRIIDGGIESKDADVVDRASGRIKQALYVIEVFIEKMKTEEAESAEDRSTLAKLLKSSVVDVASRLGVEYSTVFGKLTKELGGITAQEFREYCLRVYQSGGEDSEIFDILSRHTGMYTKTKDREAIMYMENRIKEMLVGEE